MPSPETIFLLSGLVFVVILIWLLSLISSAIFGNNGGDQSNNPEQSIQHEIQTGFAAVTPGEKVTIAVLGATAVAAIYSAWIFSGQLGEMQQATRDAHDALVAANRAWVAPRNVAITSSIAKEKGISLQIFYENFGREPGINAAILHKNDTFTEMEWSNGTFEKTAIATKDECLTRKDAPSEQVGVVYPGAGHNYSISFNTADKASVNPVVVDDGVIEGSKIYVIFGCILYKTFGLIRHSAFCDFYWAKTPNDHDMSTCHVGNDAN